MAVTEKQEEERKAAAIARAAAIERESKIWSGWAKEVSPITGVGPNAGNVGFTCRPFDYSTCPA